MIQRLTGIWKYKDSMKEILPINRVSLGEGDTPIERLHFLEVQTGVEYVYAKREDKNPTGSAKDRSIAYFFSYLKSKNIKELVVPSSGNTAISAINYGRLSGIKTYIFIPESIPKDKEARLKKSIKNHNLAQIIKSKRPLSESIKFSKNNNIRLFRGSEEVYAIEGYKTIGIELQNLRPEAIFVPVSSGTTALGIMKELKCQLHVVQTSKINTISKNFDNNFKEEKESIANAIVARVTKRKNSIINTIKRTRGWAWTIDNKAIQEAIINMENHGIKTSNEGAAAVAAFIKAVELGYKFKRVVIIFTGK